MIVCIHLSFFVVKTVILLLCCNHLTDFYPTCVGNVVVNCSGVQLLLHITSMRLHYKDKAFTDYLQTREVSSSS